MGGELHFFTKLSKVCKVVTESTSFEHFMYYRVNNTFFLATVYSIHTLLSLFFQSIALIFQQNIQDNIFKKTDYAPHKIVGGH